MKKENMGTFIGALVAVAVLVGIILLARVGYKGEEGRMMDQNSEVQSGEENNINNQEDKKMTNEEASSELKVSVISEGSGEGAKSGDNITVNYTGSLTNGTVFDSNVDPKFGHVEPFSFQLGVGMVIQGWDKGLMGAKKGEKLHLSIPSDMAYGNQAVGSVIPANSALEFDVEVISIN